MNLYTIDEFSKIVKYSRHTLYKKKNEMELNVHYFQQSKGKILFSDNAIDFILNSKKKDENEIKQRNSMSKERKSISAYKYFGR